MDETHHSLYQILWSVLLTPTVEEILSEGGYGSYVTFFSD